MSDGINTSELNYFISEKGDLVVVSLVGALTKSTQASLECCKSEIEQKSWIKYVVISLHDVSALDYAAVAGLVRLQTMIRNKSAQLRICFLKPKYREVLEDRGAIRSQEICGRLLDALKSLGLLNDGPSNP